MSIYIYESRYNEFHFFAAIKKNNYVMRMPVNLFYEELEDDDYDAKHSLSLVLNRSRLKREREKKTTGGREYAFFLYKMTKLIFLYVQKK